MASNLIARESAMNMILKAFVIELRNIFDLSQNRGSSIYATNTWMKPCWHVTCIASILSLPSCLWRSQVIDLKTSVDFHGKSI